jgi:methyl-accepting chemotaxis protein
MSQEELPNAGHFGRQIRLLESVVSMPALSVVLAYLGLLLGLTSMQWLNIGVAVAVFIVVVAVAMEFPRRSRLAPVLAYLQVRSEGEKPAPDACRKAFHSVIALPKKQMQGSMMIWISAPPFVVCLTWALGLIHWRFDHQLFVILSAGVLGALISGSFVFFGLKRTLGPIRGAIGFDISDPAERAALVTTTSLPRKVQLVVLGAVLGTSLLIGSLSQSRATQSVERLTVDWQQRVLANLEKRVESGQIFEQAVLESVPDTDLMPHPASFFLIDLEELADMGEPDDLVGRELVARISAAVSAGELHGEIIGGTANGGVAWRRLGARRLFISTLDEGSANASFDAFYVAMALALMLSAGFSLGVAHLLADDFKRATRSLSQDAERMAQGDLSRGQVWEAEDEMGSLARAFERMGGALRATVGRVAEAADRVDAAAGEISTVSQGVAIASADQVRRIQQANELMVQIKEQVGGVSDSAQNLNVSVEESSSSILELGAAGDELNDTASVLSSKVEEVSGSIEQMVRSVKQVGATTDGLSDAAADTSSSMEEMASAMRAVDNTAELTAKRRARQGDRRHPGRHRRRGGRDEPARAERGDHRRSGGRAWSRLLGGCRRDQGAGRPGAGQHQGDQSADPLGPGGERQRNRRHRGRLEQRRNGRRALRGGGYVPGGDHAGVPGERDANRRDRQRGARADEGDRARGQPDGGRA